MSIVLRNFRKYAATLLENRPGDDALSVHHPVLHLAVDVQERFSDTLFPRRQKDHPEKIREFREALRALGTPTMHVGYGQVGYFGQEDEDIKYRARLAAWQMTHPEPRGDAANLGFLVRPYKDEDIVEKYHDDAFTKCMPGSSERGLARILDNYGTKTIIMTGGNTRYCIRESAEGALRNGFNLLLVYDRLADQHNKTREELDPLWHKNQLSPLLPKWSAPGDKAGSSPSLSLVTAEECLAFIASQNNQRAAQQAVLPQVCRL